MKKNLISTIMTLMCFSSLTAQMPFQQDLVERRLQKIFSKQIKRQPYSMATIKVTGATASASKRTVQVTMDSGFSDFNFDSKTIKAVEKAVRKTLHKHYRKYTITVTVDGTDIRYLARGATLKDRQANSWGGIDYHGAPWVTNLSTPTSPTHGLYNRHLSLWASHGYFYDAKRESWRWQRPRLFCTTEDLFTSSIVVPYLIPMLENAGAQVFTPRERDFQRHEVVIDNDDSQPGTRYIEVDADRPWTTVAGTGFAMPKQAYLSNGENPFEAGTARRAKTTRKKKRYSLVSYQPSFPEAGRYAVYISYKSLPNSIDDARYTVWHKGEKTEFAVNQQMGGGTWVYLGTFDFDKGSNEYNRVVITNQSSHKGVVTTDAVRFGGGMGNILRGGHTSGLPRCLEGARYYAQWAGMPTTVYNGRKGTDDYADDINTRSLMTNYIGGGSCYMPKQKGLGVPIELSLAVHSDAGFTNENDGLIGSLGICTTSFNNGHLDAGTPRTASKDFAQALVDNLGCDLAAGYGKWNTRGVWDRNYSETRLPAVPSAIIETLSHQNFPDIRRGMDPSFRFDLARSLYKSVLRFVSRQHGLPCIVTPLAPSNFRITSVDNGIAELHWTATTDPQEPSSRPNGYIIYTAYGHSDFDNGTYVHSSNSFRLRLVPDVLYRFKVVAANRGGYSTPSETLCALYSQKATQTAMIVNGFHRTASPQVIDTPNEQGFDINTDIGVIDGASYSLVGQQTCFDRSCMGIENESGLGWSNDTLQGRKITGNTFDGVVTHAKAIQASACMNIISCSGEAVDRKQVNFDGCQLVDLMLGLECNDGYSLHRRKTFSSAMQEALLRHTANGGALLASGAYIASDMPTAAEQQFVNNVLKCSLAGTYCNPNDTLTGMNTRTTFYNRPNERHYAAVSADILQPTAPAFTTMLYANGTSACVAAKGNSNVIAMGFPFECIADESKQLSIMRAFIHFLMQR